MHSKVVHQLISDRQDPTRDVSERHKMLRFLQVEESKVRNALAYLGVSDCKLSK